MATKKFYHDIDLGQVGQLVGSRIENVTNSELTTLAGSLGAANRGYQVYNTSDSTVYTWNGSAFDSNAVAVSGDMVFKGIINPTSSSTVVPVAGQQYVVDTAGTLSNQGGAITYSPSANVEVGDVVLFTSATTASVMERNLEQATETTTGTVAIASQAETDAGVVDTDVVTPLKLHGYVDPEFAADRARLTTNEGDIATLQSDVATNAADVATNAADIATNAADIATNAGNIAAEVSRAVAAEATLASDISDEETRALAAEAALASDVATNAADIVTEAAARVSGDAAVQANVDAEETRALAAEAGLASDIAAEETRALAAEAANAAAISSEASTRAAADSALDTRVTAVEARAEVFTYTASVDLTADTALTVTHSLGLANQDAFVFNAMHSNQQISLQVGSVDANSIEVTSAVGLTGVRVTVIGV